VLVDFDGDGHGREDLDEDGHGHEDLDGLGGCMPCGGAVTGGGVLGIGELDKWPAGGPPSCCENGGLKKLLL
jgi:hypothetical protein